MLANLGALLFEKKVGCKVPSIFKLAVKRVGPCFTAQAIDVVSPMFVTESKVFCVFALKLNDMFDVLFAVNKYTVDETTSKFIFPAAPTAENTFVVSLVLKSDNSKFDEKTFEVIPPPAKLFALIDEIPKLLPDIDFVPSLLPKISKFFKSILIFYFHTKSKKNHYSLNSAYIFHFIFKAFFLNKILNKKN